MVIPHATSRDEIGRSIETHGPECDIWITGWGTPPLLGKLSRPPKVIIHAAGSIKVLQPEEAFSKGVRFASCNNALAVGVAETTLGMMIAGLKGLFFAREWTANGGWGGNFSFDRPFFKVRELYGLKIGIVAASKVGRHLIHLLKSFDVQVSVADPFLKDTDAEELGVEKVSLEQLFSENDVITIHAPFLPSTTGMVTASMIKSMRDNSLLINTARGGLIDEAALIEELQTQRISAILDVTSPEPPAADNPLRTLPNVVLSPHIAGAVNNGCLRIGRDAVNYTLDFISGRPIEGEVTFQQLAHLA